MRRLTCVKTVAVGLLLASAAVAGAQEKATLLYGTSTSVVNGAPFAITTTLPTVEHPRAQYVVAAQVNSDSNLYLLAWQDTTASLVLTGTPGILPLEEGLAGFAITGLDAGHVVTAAVDNAGSLFIATWSVDASGITLLSGYRTGTSTATKNVAITRLGPGRVVTAFVAPNGALAVEAWTIADDGRPAAEAVIGNGPSVAEVSIATVGPNQVVTAVSDSTGAMYVTTWGVNSTGVYSRDQVVFPATVNATPQAVAVGAGRARNRSGDVQSAFTPFITPDSNVDAFYWDIAANGQLTQQTTPTPTIEGDFYEVAASMLPGNIPITSYSGGSGDCLFAEWYVGGFLIDPNLASFCPSPANLNSIGSAAEGSDINPLHPHEAYKDYFVSAVAYGQLNPSPNGTLYIEVFSYPVTKDEM